MVVLPFAVVVAMKLTVAFVDKKGVLSPVKTIAACCCFWFFSSRVAMNSMKISIGSTSPQSSNTIEEVFQDSNNRGSIQPYSKQYSTYCSLPDKCRKMSRPHNSSGGRSKNRYTSTGSQRYQPKRGVPGILWTCEPGKERRCLREGLDMLQYYLDKHRPKLTVNTAEDDDNKAKKQLSLDDEIAMLQDQSKRSQRSGLPFSVYETGCKGTVFLLHTESATPKPKGGIPTTSSTIENEATDEPASKKPRIDLEKDGDLKDGSLEETNESSLPGVVHKTVPSPSQTKKDSWDSAPTVLEVFEDVLKEVGSGKAQPSDDSTATGRVSSSIPSSRFVTRMIPIQYTCFASIEEIQQTVEDLLKRHESADKSKHTFAIQTKRRCCEHLSSQAIIQAVACRVVQMKPKWTVDLRQPDYTVIIEICKTLVGVSILSGSYLSVVRNFNLAEIRARVGVATE